MAQRVVHFLKLIERDEQYAQRLPRSFRDRTRLRQPIFKQRAIRKLCNSVVVGKPVYLCSTLLQEVFELFFVTPIFLQYVAVVERALDRRLDVSQIQRFADVIKGSDSQRANREFNVLIAADHHYDGIRRKRVNAWHELESAHSAHVDVADYEVEGGVTKRRERFLCRACV